MSEPNLRELKVRAQALKPSIRLGKAGLTPEFLAAFDEALTRAKLLKIRFEGFKDERKSVAKELAEKSASLLVQQVGHTAVYYRAAKVEGQGRRFTGLRARGGVLVTGA